MLGTRLANLAAAELDFPTCPLCAIPRPCTLEDGCRSSPLSIGRRRRAEIVRALGARYDLF